MSAHQLTIEPLGDTIEVEEGQTILDACLRAGVYLPHACGHGLCGTCKTQVIDGEIDHGAASNFALMDFEREDGFVLACTATLDSDVTIEADVEEDPDARRITVARFHRRPWSVSKISPMTSRACSSRWKDGPIDFQAGQYINLVPARRRRLARLFDRQRAERREPCRVADPPRAGRRRHRLRS